MKFGQIHLVDFDPSFGKEYKKLRPAVILQDVEVTKSSPCITVMPLTSKIEKMDKYDVFVQKEHKNRLKVDSIIKVQYIQSFDKRRFHGYIGEIDSPTARRVRGYLRKHFRL